MRGVRAALALLLALVLLLGLSELHAARQRARAAAGPVDADVAAARADVADALHALESSCAETAEAALAAAGDRTDPDALFAAIEALDLPRNGGVDLYDASGELLAWTGSVAPAVEAPADDDLRAGGVFVESANGRRLAVRRRRSDAAPGAAACAVAHVPVEQRSPVRSPVLASYELARSVAARHRVGTVAVLAPGSYEGEDLASAYGGALASVDVQPLPPEIWVESVDAAAAERRAVLTTLAVLVAAGLAAAGFGRGASRARPGVWLVRAALCVTARPLLGAAHAERLFAGTPLADPGVYAGGLPLGLNASPIELVLSALALAAALACVARAAGLARRRPLPAPVAALPVALLLLAGRAALRWVIDDVVRNSTVRFLPDESVVPPAGPAALLLALVLVATAAVLAVGAALRAFAPASWTETWGRRVVLVGCAALLLAPLGPEGPPLRAGLAVAGAAGFALALAATALRLGVATRAALVPLGLALGVFAPLSRALDAALRRDLLEVAEDHAQAGTPASEGAETLFVERVLAAAVADADLVAAVQEERLPPDLTRRLWARSDLAKRSESSWLDVGGVGRPIYQECPADLPPRSWMPDLKELPADVATAWTVSRDGRGLGQDSRWVIGQRPIVGGGAVLATVRVGLEVRPSRTARLLALDETGLQTASSSRTPRGVPVDTYDGAGRLLPDASENPATPLGRRLDEALVQRVVRDGGDAWREVRQDSGAALVLVHPRRDADGAVTGALAFSVDAGGTRALMLRTTKVALAGALLSVLSLAATAAWWARGARLRLAHRLVVSYVVVSAVPLVFLAWANRQLVQERDVTERRRELREATSVLQAAMHTRDVPAGLAAIDPRERAGLGFVGLADSIPYSPGRRGSVYRMQRLVATTDQGLVDTELLPSRMPGRAFHEIVLLGRVFHVETARVGDQAVNVGYAPVRDPRSPTSEVIGAVSVALVHEDATREREQAAAVTAVLGFYLASIVAVMGLGSLVAERLTKPLRLLRLATRRVAAGDLSEPVPGAGPSELGQVVEAFNTMVRDLAESRERLVRAEKEAAWRDMARQVAHEVKNPLTPMRLAAEHLRRAHADGSPDFARVLQRSVDVIVRQTENLRRIVTDFRDFARMPVQRREPVDVGRLASEVLDLYRGVPGLTVEVAADATLPAVLADPDELRRVLVNVAGNSVEALAGRAGRLAARVTSPDAAHVVVVVADDGPGVPAEVLPRLFEPNFSTKTGGTGLGLAICKRAVEDLGGTITLESTAGAGTTVTITLPAGDASRAAALQERA